MRKITILGSTGSIGISTIILIKKYPKLFKIIALVANKNFHKMLEQCIYFKPIWVSMTNKYAANILQKTLKELNIKTKVLSGIRSACKLASLDEINLVVSGISGIIGLLPTVSAIKSGKTIFLANKESLIICGKLLIKEIIKYNANIIPIDSEHNAIFQILPLYMQKKIGTMNLKNIGIKSVILTGSGGPLLKVPLSHLSKINAEQACNHPNWSMGKKISVDSATMMNKGLEYIETSLLFNLTNKEIEIIIHPESIIHSMVRYINGNIIANLGFNSMQIPISYAMFWPKRINTNNKEIDFDKINNLTFLKPNFDRFPCLKLSIEAFKESQSSIIILNAANDIAVYKFLHGKIKFTSIANINEQALLKISFKEPHSIKSVLDIYKNSLNIIEKKILPNFEY